MSKHVLVTGSKGQLGSSIGYLANNYLGLSFTFTDVEELDLSSSQSIETYLAEHEFDIIINCAAYTAVDKAETEQALADKINHQAVKTLAEIAKKQKITLIHISTDYVFNGQNYKPYQEADSADPQCVYGETKLKGEQAFSQVNPKGCILRTSWVYSEYGNNFVKTMLRLGNERSELGVIFDQIGTPTYARDLARAILDIVSNDANTLHLNSENKVYHFSNEGVCSWYDFAKNIFELTQTQCSVNPIETKEYPTPASRPHYSVMNKGKIKQAFGLNIPHWKDSLVACLAVLKEQN